MRYVKFLMVACSALCLSEKVLATDNSLPPKSKWLCDMRVDTFGAGGAWTRAYYSSKLDIPVVVDFFEKKYGTKAKQVEDFFVITKPGDSKHRELSVMPTKDYDNRCNLKLPRGTRSIIID